MHIFDAHLDLALNGVDWNRDLRATVREIRSQEEQLGMQDQPGRTNNTLSFPELRKAEVKTCLATLLARQEPEINHAFGWISEHTCYSLAHAHLAYYRAMEQAGELRILRSRSDLQDHLDCIEQSSVSNANARDTDQLAEPNEASPLGVILTMEGADPLLQPDTLDEFFRHGLRAIGLTHYGDNRYGGGTNSSLGLQPKAYQLLDRIASLGITLDVTHLSDRSFEEAAGSFDGRIHASHQNSRRLSNWQRQFTDDQYRTVLGRGGMIGIAFDIVMLQDGYVRRESKRTATIETAVENIDIVCQLAGNATQVGIGSDLDGGYGADQTPCDLDTIADLQQVPELLTKHGYTDEEIRGIMHENWQRFFLEALPSS